MKILHSDKAPKALGPYSQGYESNGLLFLSGQGGINPETGILAEGVQAQTVQAIQNLQAVLQSAGSDLSRVIKTTCFLTDMNDFKAFNEVYAQYFTSNPSRSCVAVKELPANFLVEIEVIAEK